MDADTRSDFQKHSMIIASALSVCEKLYQGALGHDLVPPDKSTIALDPLGLLKDMQDALLIARNRIKNPAWLNGKP